MKLLVLTLIIIITLALAASALPSTSYDYGADRKKGDHCISMVPEGYFKGLTLIRFSNVDSISRSIESKNFNISKGGYKYYDPWIGRYSFFYSTKNNGRIKIAQYNNLNESELCSILLHEIGHHYDNFYLFKSGFIQNQQIYDSEMFAQTFSDTFFENKIKFLKDYPIWHN